MYKVHKNRPCRLIAKRERKRKRRLAFLSLSLLVLTACAQPERLQNTGAQGESAQKETAQKETAQKETAQKETAQKETAQKETAESEKTQAAEEDLHTSAASAPSALSAPTDYVSDEEMELADCWQGSKENAIAKVMRKAAQGEKITVAVIGGSITEGTISSGSKDASVAEKRCYADIFFSWWETTFPQTEIAFINAGIGATDSYLGVHRVEEDVLKNAPDIVLVEFAVNDANTAFYKKTYDALVRTIAQSENAPALLLLFMAQTNGACAQENQSLVGFSYSMPMISYGNVMKEMLDSGKYSEKDLSGDTVHPSALGHAITGEILWKYLNSVYADMDAYDEPEAFPQKTAAKEYYRNAEILDSAKIKPDSSRGFAEKKVSDIFPNGWSCEEGDGEITFTASFANLGILYYCRTEGEGGQYEVYVDGEPEAVLDADFENGWGSYAKAQECFASDETKEHEIMLKRKEDSTGDTFELLGLLVSEGAE